MLAISPAHQRKHGPPCVAKNWNASASQLANHLDGLVHPLLSPADSPPRGGFANQDRPLVALKIHFANFAENSSGGVFQPHAQAARRANRPLPTEHWIQV